MTKSSSFQGGSLSFKGDGKKSKKDKKSKKKAKKSKHSLKDGDASSSEQLLKNKQQQEAVVDGDDVDDYDDDELTEAEKKAMRLKRERQRAESEKIAKKSHRQRVEELNEKLSTLTELNDIPRVSAAGNGWSTRTKLLIRKIGNYFRTLQSSQVKSTFEFQPGLFPTFLQLTTNRTTTSAKQYDSNSMTATEEGL